VSSDQISYVLVALLVAGLATLLLLAGAFVARRGNRDGAPAPAAAAAAYPPLERAAPVELAPLREDDPEPPPIAALPAASLVEPEIEPEIEPVAAPSAPEPPAEEVGAVTAADLAEAARRVHDPREEEIIEGFLSIAPRRRVADEAPRPPTAVGPGLAAAAPAAPEAVGVASSREPERAEEMPPPVAPGVARPAPIPADPYLDEVTGLDSRSAWDRLVAEENARYVRYRRPVSVVVGELDGLVRFEDQFGAEAARRVLAAVGEAMRRGARRTDRVAHAGGGRFLVLMPETDEIQAINYVERVRAECERWLEAGASAMRLSLGWASPSAVGELDTALRTAEERMYAERRRVARAGSGDPGASR
jgi:diguanylate cyclase (GGDEF)-like protein